MNIFRLAGDMSHLASILVLYHKISYTRSCKGMRSSLLSLRCPALVHVCDCTLLITISLTTMDSQASL